MKLNWYLLIVLMFLVIGCSIQKQQQQQQIQKPCNILYSDVNSLPSGHCNIYQESVCYQGEMYICEGFDASQGNIWHKHWSLDEIRNVGLGETCKRGKLIQEFC